MKFNTVKSQSSELRLSETTGLFEDDGQSRLRRSRLKKLLLNYPSRFEVQMSHMVIMISLFGRVRFTHLGDLEKKVETGN